MLVLPEIYCGTDSAMVMKIVKFRTEKEIYLFSLKATGL
jgi:hypothetical protein